VRATVDQDDIGLVRNHLRKVRIMLASDTRRAYDAAIVREVPGAVGELPSRALAIEGGGKVATDPRDPESTKTVAPLFQFEMRLPPDAPTMALGSRVYVRFEHDWEPIGRQAWRRLRQVLMTRLNG
jgi:putative peptide zinc metalloprotease protein